RGGGWRGGWSQAWLERAQASVNNAAKREAEASDKQLFHMQAQRFETPSQAQEALAVVAKKWHYHQGAACELSAHKRYGKKGRPTADTPLKGTQWQLHAQVRPDTERLEALKRHKACFVRGTDIRPAHLSHAE